VVENRTISLPTGQAAVHTQAQREDAQRKLGIPTLGVNCLLPLPKESSEVRTFLLAVACRRGVSPEMVRFQLE
jgi:hypothetical protein